MSKKGTFTADETTDWFTVKGHDGVHVSGKGTFGSGTIAIEQKLMGDTHAYVDSTGTALEYTANFDVFLDLRDGDVIRLDLDGSTDPDINWVIQGRV